MQFKVLDLFSGIGGFSLGLEQTKGFETVAFCEIDKYCRKVLSKHWPNVRQYDDIRNLTANVLRADGLEPDVICGGFPCQDISVAGKGAGINGERSGLWKEYARLISELRPKYVLVENVSALLSRGLSDVLGDLASLGYDAEWHCIPASYIGAWHRRDRIWLFTYPTSQFKKCNKISIFQQSDLSKQLSRSFAKWPGRSNLSASRFYRRNDGVPNWVDRLKCLGNAVVPQIPELLGYAILEMEKNLNETKENA